MTRERDFDAIARAWLDEGPSEAPDRAVASVLQAVASTPQQRRSMRWLTRRVPTMNRLMLAAAVAAALVIAVGGGALFLTSSGPPADIGASPSPSLSASPVAAVPAELEHLWLGDLRDVAGLETDRSMLEFTTRSVDYSQLLYSAVTSAEPGQINVTVQRPAAGCDAGDEGIYAYRLSPGGTRLALTLVDDACAARGEALAGEWFRSDCLNPDNACLGPLEAGEFPSFFFAPRLELGAVWAPEFGALRYTVPEGWAATSDYPREYFLEPTDWYESPDHDFARATRGIYVGSHVVPFEEEGGCGPAVAADVDLNASALAAWTAAHPGLDTTEPEDLTIAGYSGRIVDVTAVADWGGICTGAPSPVAVLFGEAEGDASDRAWGPLVGEPNRFIFIDIGEAHPVLVNISAPADQFDALLPEAMQIVESFEFE